MITLDTLFVSLYNFVQREDQDTDHEMIMYLMSEVGELSENILTENGIIQKQLKESYLGEAADVFICLMSVIAKHELRQSQDRTVSQVLDNFKELVKEKANKYVANLDSRNKMRKSKQEPEITYILGDTEVKKTGRQAAKELPSGKQDVLYEVTPVQQSSGQWKRWVRQAELHTISAGDIE